MLAKIWYIVAAILLGTTSVHRLIAGDKKDFFVRFILFLYLIKRTNYEVAVFVFRCMADIEALLTVATGKPKPLPEYLTDFISRRNKKT